MNIDEHRWKQMKQKKMDEIVQKYRNRNKIQQTKTNRYLISQNTNNNSYFIVYIA